MESRILVLGAGFGGLELAAILSERLGDEAGVTLIEAGDAFVFGFAKLDVMFGRAEPEEVRLRYADFGKPGVQFLNERVVAIDPETRRVTTDRGVREADVLVLALGADYDYDATPGLSEANEFYSVAGAERQRDVIPGFTSGHAIVAVCGAPYKCPPAPSEAVLLLHDHLTEKGVRGDCEITLVTPLGTPVPPSPDTSCSVARGIRRARNRVHRRPNGEIDRHGSQRCRARGRYRAAVRPLPRRSEAPSTASRAG